MYFNAFGYPVDYIVLIIVHCLKIMEGKNTQEIVHRNWIISPQSSFGKMSKFGNRSNSLEQLKEVFLVIKLHQHICTLCHYRVFSYDGLPVATPLTVSRRKARLRWMAWGTILPDYMYTIVWYIRLVNVFPYTALSFELPFLVPFALWGSLPYWLLLWV